MRTIIYAIFNKETNEKIYVNARHSECEKMMNTLENKEKFEIRYKWRSF